MTIVPHFWDTSPFGAGLALDLLVVAACIATPLRRVGSLILAAAALLWLFVDKAFEAGTILLISTTHGLNTTDLAGILALAYAIWLWFAPRSRE